MLCCRVTSFLLRWLPWSLGSVKALKAENAGLTKDNKACNNQMRVTNKHTLTAHVTVAHVWLCVVVQGDKFSAQVAALESGVKALKAENAGLTKDNKACYCQMRAKDKELAAAAKQVAQAQQTEIQNKVRGCSHVPSVYSVPVVET